MLYASGNSCERKKEVMHFLWSSFVTELDVLDDSRGQALHAGIECPVQGLALVIRPVFEGERIRVVLVQPGKALNLMIAEIPLNDHRRSQAEAVAA